VGQLQTGTRNSTRQPRRSVDEGEGNLGLAGLDDEIPAAAGQGRAPVLVRDRDELQR
jgi:hypothetical protein